MPHWTIFQARKVFDPARGRHNLIVYAMPLNALHLTFLMKTAWLKAIPSAYSQNIFETDNSAAWLPSRLLHARGGFIAMRNASQCRV